MVNQTDTLSRLNREKNYEDKLVDNLNNYFIYSLDNIKDISVDEKDKIKQILETIMKESHNHSFMFDQLIQMVIEHGEDTY